METLSYQVGSEEEGHRLVNFLKGRLGERYSSKVLKKRIEQGACGINGKIVRFASHPLRKKDKVVFTLPEEILSAPTLSILYEDEYLLAVNKPSGFLCDPQFASKYLTKSYAGCRLAHRLDKNTSGVLLLAKTKEVEEVFYSLFATKGIKKQYLAIVEGMMAQDEGLIHSKLEKEKGSVRATFANSGKESSTHWICLSRGTKSSLVLCEPITGRTHQIRVHLQSINHPILGDGLYTRASAGAGAKVFSRHMLHAYKVCFKHPVTQQDIEIKAPIPSDFKKALEELLLSFS